MRHFELPCKERSIIEGKAQHHVEDCLRYRCSILRNTRLLVFHQNTVVRCGQVPARRGTCSGAYFRSGLLESLSTSRYGESKLVLRASNRTGLTVSGVPKVLHRSSRQHGRPCSVVLRSSMFATWKKIQARQSSMNVFSCPGKSAPHLFLDWVTACARLWTITKTITRYCV